MKKTRSVGSLPRCFLRDRIIHLHERLRQRLIDEHRDDRAQQSLDESKRHVEDHERLDQRIRRGQDRLIQVQDVFHPAEQARVNGVDDEIIRRDADKRHCCSAGNACDQRAGLRLFVSVDHSRRESEHSAQNEIGKLADAEGHRDRAVQQVLDKTDQHARDRTDRERADQLGDVGKIELQERRHERHREFKILQRRGDGG